MGNDPFTFSPDQLAEAFGIIGRDRSDSKAVEFVAELQALIGRYLRARRPATTKQARDCLARLQTETAVLSRTLKAAGTDTNGLVYGALAADLNQNPQRFLADLQSRLETLSKAIGIASEDVGTSQGGRPSREAKNVLAEKIKRLFADVLESRPTKYVSTDHGQSSAYADCVRFALQCAGEKQTNYRKSVMRGADWL